MTDAAARYGEKETTHRFPKLFVKLEIINISMEFVAGFGNSQKKKVSNGTLREKCWVATRQHSVKWRKA